MFTAIASVEGCWMTDQLSGFRAVIGVSVTLPIVVFFRTDASSILEIVVGGFGEHNLVARANYVTGVWHPADPAAHGGAARRTPRAEPAQNVFERPASARKVIGKRHFNTAKPLSEKALVVIGEASPPAHEKAAHR